MRIAMIGVKGVPHPGGIEVFVEHVGPRLVELGHEVTVYVRAHYTPKTQSAYRGMRLVHLPSIATKHLDAITHGFLATLHAMAAGADIAHIHSIGLSPLALPLRLAGIRTVVQVHGMDWQREKWGICAKLYLRATDYTSTLVPHVTTVVSRKMERYYGASSASTVRFIPNGVAECPRVPAQEILRIGLAPDQYILFAARLVPEKGLHYLIEAFRRASQPKKLVVAGDANYGGRYAADLKKQAGDRVVFLGYVTGRLLQELLSWAYCYVLPSTIEGLSIGLLEAMAYGNCVLASDIEENREVVGANGVCFRSGDVNSLEEKLNWLFRRPDLVLQYRARARDFARRHCSWDAVAGEYDRLYRALMDSAKPAAARTVPN